MKRKAERVNPIRGARLKILLSEHHMEQKELADKMGYTKEHISYIVNGRRNLTADAAEAIVKLLPTANIDWLMGYSDFKTDDQRVDTLIRGKNEITELITRQMALHGYHIVEMKVPPTLSEMSKIERKEYELRPFNHIKYAIRAPSGALRVLEQSDISMIFFTIDNFVEFTCSNLVKRPFEDYLHTRKDEK